MVNRELTLKYLRYTLEALKKRASSQALFIEALDVEIKRDEMLRDKGFENSKSIQASKDKRERAEKDLVEIEEAYQQYWDEYTKHRRA